MKMSTPSRESYSNVLQSLNEIQVITGPDMNLRSKIDSLVRSIENLSEKKLRIDFEIKKQKRSLARKRNELKKSSAHFRATLESAAEIELRSGEFVSRKELVEAIDNYLFQSSDRVLND